MGLAFETNERDEPRLGLIVLQSDETIENEFCRMIPSEATLHVSRVPSADEVTPETLAEMEHHISASARLLPLPARFDAVGYGCTSGTSVIGIERIGDLVRSGTTTRSVTEPVSALIAACGELGVSRLAFLSPYVGSVSSRMRAVLAENGIDTPLFGSFETSEEALVARITPASILEAAVSLMDDPAAEAIFISCTNLRTLDIIEEIEDRTGRPALSSNQVLAWHLCRLAGMEIRKKEFGKLLSDNS
ncbi:maleate cis-trans isomerase family protein [Oricola indica]|uniref:maleate cis-trans isomerase family protein n=1 Tax=Oricola indica TaxID=2872591 RepID=UPI003CCBE2AA